MGVHRMKLLMCTRCSDVFKLSRYETRSCRCGLVKGRYDNNGLDAVSNGKGISLAINNFSLMDAMARIDLSTCTYDDFREMCKVECWVRPNSGPGNPRSKVDEELS